MSDNIKVEYVDFGIANNFGSYIEINKNLKKYPQLMKSILNHELKHKAGGFTFEDLKLDMTDRVNNWELAMFIFHHPKALHQFLPFYYTRKKGFVYDTNLIILYTLLLVTIGIGSFIAFNL